MWIIWKYLQIVASQPPVCYKMFRIQKTVKCEHWHLHGNQRVFFAADSLSAKGRAFN